MSDADEYLTTAAEQIPEFRPQLRELAKPFPPSLIQRKPGRGGADYVEHGIITQRLLATIGPFDQEVVMVLRGHAPEEKSTNGSQVWGPFEDAIVGVVLRLTYCIDGQRVRIEEAGECEHPSQKDTDGDRLKDAISNALRRCAMRIGVGLHLWGRSDYVLDASLTHRAAEHAKSHQAAPAASTAPDPARARKDSPDPSAALVADAETVIADPSAPPEVVADAEQVIAAAEQQSRNPNLDKTPVDMYEPTGAPYDDIPAPQPDPADIMWTAAGAVFKAITEATSRAQAVREWTAARAALPDESDAQRSWAAADNDQRVAMIAGLRQALEHADPQYGKAMDELRTRREMAETMLAEAMSEDVVKRLSARFIPLGWDVYDPDILGGYVTALESALDELPAPPSAAEPEDPSAATSPQQRAAAAARAELDRILAGDDMAAAANDPAAAADDVPVAAVPDRVDMDQYAYNGLTVGAILDALRGGRIPPEQVREFEHLRPGGTRKSIMDALPTPPAATGGGQGEEWCRRQIAALTVKLPAVTGNARQIAENRLRQALDSGEVPKMQAAIRDVGAIVAKAASR